MAKAEVTIKATTTEFGLITEALELLRDESAAAVRDPDRNPGERQKMRERAVRSHNLIEKLQ